VIGKTLREPERRVVRAVVRMVDDLAVADGAGPDRVLQGAKDQVGVAAVSSSANPRSRFE